MKIEIDTHSHTLVSGHAYNTLREMAHMAAEKGLKGLAVTEHAPEMPGSTGRLPAAIPPPPYWAHWSPY